MAESLAWRATDEVANEAQEIYDFKTKVGDPYVMHRVLDYIVRKYVACARCQIEAAPTTGEGETDE